MKSGTLVATVVLLGLLCEPAVAGAVKALVVTADYGSGKQPALALANVSVDTGAIAQTLRKLNDVEVAVASGDSPETWRATLDAFASTLGQDDIALVYYAGHAVQVKGKNFFLAGDGVSLISMDQVVQQVSTRVRGTIFVVDACRNSPSVDSAIVRDLAMAPTRGIQVAWADIPAEIASTSRIEIDSSAQGLQQLSDLRGRNILVLFSTDPGNVALDGEAGQGSPFANALTRQLARRQSLNEAITRTTDEVHRATKGRQSPWRQGDLAFPLFLAGQPRFPVP